MVYNFDLKYFCENLKATKPPYECPVKNCGKIYKTHTGIQYHLYNFDHDNPENAGSSTPAGGRSPNRSPVRQKTHGSWHHRQTSPLPIQIDFSPSACEFSSPLFDSKKVVEVELGGHAYQINIQEPLEIIVQDDMEHITDAEKENTDKHDKGTLQVSVHKDGPPRKEGALSPGIKLPEACFKVLDDYVKPVDVPPQNVTYYRYIEKTPEELEEHVEYDMDEEVCNTCSIKMLKFSIFHCPGIKECTYKLLHNAVRLLHIFTTYAKYI